MSELLTFSGFPYGAVELKKFYQKYLIEASVLAVLLHFIVSWAIVKFLIDNRKQEARITTIIGVFPFPPLEIQPPLFPQLPTLLNPDIDPFNHLSVKVASMTTELSAGTPVPVPEIDLQQNTAVVTKSD